MTGKRDGGKKREDQLLQIDFLPVVIIIII